MCRSVIHSILPTDPAKYFASREGADAPCAEGGSAGGGGGEEGGWGEEGGGGRGVYEAYGRVVERLVGGIDEEFGSGERGRGGEEEEEARKRVRRLGGEEGELQRALGGEGGEGLLYDTYCSWRGCLGEGEGDMDETLYAFCKTHQPEKHIFRKAANTERLVGGRMEFGEGGGDEGGGDAEEYVQVAAEEDPPHDEYVPSSSFAFAGQFSLGQSGRRLVD